MQKHQATDVNLPENMLLRGLLLQAIGPGGPWSIDLMLSP